MTLDKQTFTLPSGLQYDFYSPPQAEAFQKTVIYYHGGGLIYGTRSDLPVPLAELLLTQGYTIISMDHLLAPNSSLATILASVFQNFDSLAAEKLQQRPFWLMGRSGGSFICFQLAQHLLKQSNPAFQGLINFYGYTDLSFIAAANPQLTLVKEEQLAHLDTSSPLHDDPFLQRSLLYYWAAQQGRLAELYNVTDPAVEFALADDLLAQLPRSFHSASANDQEVPFRYSKRMKKLNAQATFIPVYDLEHDFLKLTAQPQVQKVLLALKDWLP